MFLINSFFLNAMDVSDFNKFLLLTSLNLPIYL